MINHINNKVPLILFTGGVDSTYLLQHRLYQSEVDILYVHGCIEDLKKEAEINSRNKIIKYFKNNKNLFPIRNSYICNFPFDDKAPGWDSFQFQQLPIWIFAALFYSNPEIHSCVEIAYVLNDEVMVHRAAIIETWNKFNEISKIEQIPLNFPLWLNRKSEIINSLGDLYAYTWSCETPIKVNNKILKCDVCPACKRKKWEEFNLN